MRPHSSLLLGLLCTGAIAAGCGGESGGPTAPPSATTITLTLDFHPIEVEEDCDGIEGDGDFRFSVETVRSPTDTAVDVVYDKSISIGPGGNSGPLGRRSYTFSGTEYGERTVRFGASEMDRDVFGTVYNDSRLSFQSGFLVHFYNNGTWNTLGDHSITLGGDGCRVRLRWTASATAT